MTLTDPIENEVKLGPRFRIACAPTCDLLRVNYQG